MNIPLLRSGADPVARAEENHATNEVKLAKELARLAELQAAAVDDPSPAVAGKLAAQEALIRALQAKGVALREVLAEVRSEAFCRAVEQTEGELSAAKASREVETRKAILSLLAAAAAFARFDRHTDFAIRDFAAAAELSMRRAISMVGLTADRREAVSAEARKLFSDALAAPRPADLVAELEARLADLQRRGPE